MKKKLYIFAAVSFLSGTVFGADDPFAREAKHKSNLESVACQDDDDELVAKSPIIKTMDDVRSWCRDAYISEITAHNTEIEELKTAIEELDEKILDLEIQKRVKETDHYVADVRFQDQLEVKSEGVGENARKKRQRALNQAYREKAQQEEAAALIDQDIVKLRQHRDQIIGQMEIAKAKFRQLLKMGPFAKGGQFNFEECSFSESDIDSLVSVALGIPYFEEIVFRHCGMPVSCSEKLAKCFAGKKIKRFVFNDSNEIGIAACKALSNTPVDRIDWRYIPQKEGSIEKDPICEVITNNDELEELRLAGCYNCSVTENVGHKNAFEAMQHAKNLHKCAVWGGYTQHLAYGINAWMGDMLTQNKSLNTLDIRFLSVPYLFRFNLTFNALRTNQTLTELSVWCTEIDSRDITALGEVLPLSPLKKLSLMQQNNRLLSIFKAVKDSNIESLNIGPFTSMGKPKFTISVPDALECFKSKKLKFLALKNCGIEDEGAKEISKALDSCKTITSLNLEDNPISDVILSEINAKLEANKSSAAGAAK